MKIKFTLLVILLLSFCVNAQWTAVNNGLGSLQIRGVGVSQNTVIAVTVDQGMFVSTDNGDNWQPHPNNNHLSFIRIILTHSTQALKFLSQFQTLNLLL